MRIRAKYVSLFDPDIEGIAKRWKAQYHEKSGTWKSTSFGDSGMVYSKLVVAKTLDECDNAIGNKSWTHFLCDGCRNYTRTAVLIGDGDHNGYCPTCLAEAQELLKEVIS